MVTLGSVTKVLADSLLDLFVMYAVGIQTWLE